MESGLRQRRKLVEDLLVRVFCRPIRQMLAALRFADAVLRHEVHPIPDAPLPNAGGTYLKWYNAECDLLQTTRMTGMRSF